MVRTQVQLTEAQVRSLKAIAKKQGVSMAEVVRRCIDVALSARCADLSAFYEQAAEVVGAFSDRAGVTDLSREHDRYLEDAFG